jgi:hypothetical protein
VCFALAVSDLALIICAATDWSFAHDGIKRQRTRQFTARFLRILPDDGNRLSGSNVIARSPVVFARDAVQILFDNLFPPRQSIATAH